MREAPKIEFFYDLTDEGYTSARCVHWDAPLYQKLLDCRMPYYSTVGWSEAGWSPFLVAVELIKIITQRFTNPEAYLVFLGDLAELSIAKEIPEYCAPILISSTNPERFFERTGYKSSDFEDIINEIDNIFNESFYKFLEKEHNSF